jgi:thiol-disulfide isomerase/thioredoxin
MSRLMRPLAVILMLITASLQAQQVPASYEEQFEKGRQLLARREYFDALKAFQRANQLAGGKSAESFVGMAQAMIGMKVYKNAIDASQSAIELARSDWRVLARAHKIRGEAFQASGDLSNAETEFRAAIAADSNEQLADLHYALGAVLLAQQRDDEGVVELRKEIELRPHGTTAEDAQALIANPRRAREKYAPEFSIRTAEHQQLSLDALRGKVVLLDFWASWCAPCVKALPSARRLQKDHANDPFVIIGISGDREERTWHEFVEKNGMVWPQYLDRDHRMQSVFGVKAIPTYVLIDQDGIERLRVTGSGFHEARALGAEIEKQIKIAVASRMTK